MGVVESARKPRPHPFCRHLPVPPGGDWGFPTLMVYAVPQACPWKALWGCPFCQTCPKHPHSRMSRMLDHNLTFSHKQVTQEKKEKSSFIFILRQTQCCDCYTKNHVHQRHCCSWSLSHWTSSWSSANLHPHRLIGILHVFIWPGKKGQKLTRRTKVRMPRYL